MKTIRKALMAAGFTAAGAIGTACLDGTLSLPEVTVALGLGLGAGAATYKVPND